mmetsp:Transcript_49141/g.159742  ORF Transcript_49141/g.159742 Transcript_49141/m.159742 type:complete len:220 (+) Transcript_49141:52-711(+)
MLGSQGTRPHPRHAAVVWKWNGTSHFGTCVVLSPECERAIGKRPNMRSTSSRWLITCRRSSARLRYGCRLRRLRRLRLRLCRGRLRRGGQRLRLGDDCIRGQLPRPAWVAVSRRRRIAALRLIARASMPPIRRGLRDAPATPSVSVQYWHISCGRPSAKAPALTCSSMVDSAKSSAAAHEPAATLASSLPHVISARSATSTNTEHSPNKKLTFIATHGS